MDWICGVFSDLGRGKLISFSQTSKVKSADEMSFAPGEEQQRKNTFLCFADTVGAKGEKVDIR
jgi:hypothetical protein